MSIDPNKFSGQRKRSSLKHNLFPEGVSYEEYLAQKNKKLQWDTKAEEIEVVEPGTEAKIVNEVYLNILITQERRSNSSYKKSIQKKCNKTYLFYQIIMEHEITELPKEENEQPKDETEVEIVKEIEVKFEHKSENKI